MFGMNVHKAVIESGETISGATIHLVDEIYDNGRILNQMQIEVMPNDTPETLAEKVLTIEHKLYPTTIQLIIEGKQEDRQEKHDYTIREVRATYELPKNTGNKKLFYNKLFSNRKFFKYRNKSFNIIRNIK